MCKRGCGVSDVGPACVNAACGFSDVEPVYRVRMRVAVDWTHITELISGSQVRRLEVLNADVGRASKNQQLCKS